MNDAQIRINELLGGIQLETARIEELGGMFAEVIDLHAKTLAAQNELRAHLDRSIKLGEAYAEELAQLQKQEGLK